MPSDGSLRRRLLALAHDLLRGAGAESPGEPLVVRITRGKTSLTHEADPGEVAALLAVVDLPELHQCIVEALQEAGGEVGPKELARRAGYKYGPHFRTAMRELQVKGIVRKGLDGYQLGLGPTP